MSEEQTVAHIINLQNRIARVERARDEACDIALTYVTAYLHTQPGQRDRDQIAALKKVK